MGETLRVDRSYRDPALSARVTLGANTFRRPHAVQRLVVSARRQFGDALRIIIADQSRRTPEMEEFYLKHDVDAIWVGYDVGVGVSRNAILERVKTEFFLLADDDFIMVDETCLEEALKILDGNNRLGVLGGRLADIYNDGSEALRYWENFISMDVNRRFVQFSSIYTANPVYRLSRGIRYYSCDAVLNWALMRNEMFAKFPSIRWDPRFKCVGEHEDFYMNLQKNAHWDVGYFPGLFAKHHHPTSFVYNELRERHAGWLQLFDKWDLDQLVDSRSGIRSRSRPDLIKIRTDTHEDFFATPDHTLATSGGSRLYVTDDGRAFASKPTSSTRVGPSPADVNSTTVLVQHLRSNEYRAVALPQERAGQVVVSQSLAVEACDSSKLLWGCFAPEEVGPREELILYVRILPLSSGLRIPKATKILVNFRSSGRYLGWQGAGWPVRSSPDFWSAVHSISPALTGKYEYIVSIVEDDCNSIRIVARGSIDVKQQRSGSTTRRFAWGLLGCDAMKQMTISAKADTVNSDSHETAQIKIVLDRGTSCAYFSDFNSDAIVHGPLPPELGSGSSFREEIYFSPFANIGSREY